MPVTSIAPRTTTSITSTVAPVAAAASATTSTPNNVAPPIPSGAPASGAVASLPLPAWVPASFDLKASAAAARALLEAQGEPASSFDAGKVSTMLFSDGDGTIFKSGAPVYLKNKETGELLRDPNNGALLMIPGATSKDNARALAELKAKLPSLPWDKIGMDYSEFDNIAEILRTPIVAPMIARLRRSDKNEKSRDFVVTARTVDKAVIGIREALRQKGLDINGVITTGNPNHTTPLGIADPAVRSGQKKALAIAAMITAYGAENIHHVRFHDDGDDNLIASMQLLPKLFPHIRFEFFDSIHKGEGVFEPRRVAVSHRDGSLTDGKGAVLDDAAVASYASKDVPFNVDVSFAGPPRRRSPLVAFTHTRP
jgi:hypothetical protein